MDDRTVQGARCCKSGGGDVEVGVGSAGAGAAAVCEFVGVGEFAAGGVAGVRGLPQGESWNQDLRDELRVRFGRGKQVQMGKGRSGLELD
jgi:hypothetical protein